MTAEVRILPSALSQVRVELMSMISHIDAATVPTRPVRSDAHRNAGTLDIWCETRSLTVHTARRDGAGVVFMSQPSQSWLIEVWPDWTALSAIEARTIGNALIAAANVADGVVAANFPVSGGNT